MLQVVLEKAYGEEWAQKAGIPVVPVDAEMCSFCGKGRHEVDRLVAGCSGFICNECSALVRQIFEEGSGGDPAPN